MKPDEPCAKWSQCLAPLSRTAADATIPDPEIGFWLSLSWVPCLHNIILKAICLFEWFWMYIYIMYHHVLSICCLTYCIDSFIQLAAQNRLSRRDFSRKTHPPWDDPHGMLAGVVPIKINMGGHPPIKKKTPFWIFCFCWESRVLMFLTWWFWCWLRMIQMVQERICIAQSQWRRCFVVMTIYI